MKDLTILFPTFNSVPESWAAFHRQTLLEAAGDYPIISISRIPIDVGINIPDEPHPNKIYWQLLRAAKIATTPYVAVVEDDTLYHRSHFTEFRPPLDTFAYNQHRWSLFTWGNPLYSWKNNRAGCACIAPRELMIEAAEERFAKYPDGVPRRICGEFGIGYEEWMGVTERKSMEFYSTTAIIQFNHDYFSTAPNNPETIARMHRKRMGLLRSSDIPYWGKSAELVKKFI